MKLGLDGLKSEATAALGAKSARRRGYAEAIARRIRATGPGLVILPLEIPLGCLK